MARPYVSGKFLYHPNGTEWTPVMLIKYWSHTYYRPNADQPTNWYDETDAVYDMMASLADQPVIVKQSINRWCWDNDSNYKPACDWLVDKCTDRGMYCSFQWQEWEKPGSPPTLYWPGVNDGYYLKWWTGKRKVIEDNYEDWISFIEEIANRYKNNDTVIGIDPLNEPPKYSPYWSTAYPSIGLGAIGTFAEAQGIWESRVEDVCEAVHAIDDSYLFFLGSARIGSMSYDNVTPINCNNVIYGLHNYWSWEVGYGGYADAYYNATTEQDFIDAYALFEAHIDDHFITFRDANNVPVMNLETSTGKKENGTYYNNRYRQFYDQLKVYASRCLGHAYFSCDRDKSHGYYGLLNNAIPTEDWAMAGDNYVNGITDFYPPTPCGAPVVPKASHSSMLNELLAILT